MRNEQLSSGSATSSEAHAKTVRLSIPAQPEFITLTRLALAGLSRVRVLSEETLADLKLAITEACSNSVRHAYAGSEGIVEIVYRLEPDRIEIEVSDNGTGFDHAAARAPAEDPDLSEGGLGIAIIRSIADDFELATRADGRGSRLRFVKNLDS